MSWAFPRFALSIQSQEDSLLLQEVKLALLIHIHHPPIGKYPSVAPQTNSLGSLYISKSIYGTWMYLQVFRICWSHQCPSKHFLFSKTSSRRLQYFFTKTNVCWGNSWTVKEQSVTRFELKFPWRSFNALAFCFSKFLHYNLSNERTGNKEVHKPMTDCNWL